MLNPPKTEYYNKVIIYLKRKNINKGAMMLALLLYTFKPLYSQENTYPTEHRLFHIARSVNKNLVCYDVNDAEGKLDTQNPLNIYWINREESPGKTKELSFFQKKVAYGYKLLSKGNDACEISLSASPDRKLTIRKQGNKYVCLATINNRPAVLQSLFVKAKPNNPLSVEYVELHGIIPATGQIVSERIVK